ncbi:MAG: hypothetical protein GY882_00185 [Actinomycetia bacterium]|nr:hypothetical protein [Actinomycetes bacterium]
MPRKQTTRAHFVPTRTLLRSFYVVAAGAVLAMAVAAVSLASGGTRMSSIAASDLSHEVPADSTRGGTSATTTRSRPSSRAVEVVQSVERNGNRDLGLSLKSVASAAGVTKGVTSAFHPAADVTVRVHNLSAPEFVVGAVTESAAAAVDLLGGVVGFEVDTINVVLFSQDEWEHMANEAGYGPLDAAGLARGVNQVFVFWENAGGSDMVISEMDPEFEPDLPSPHPSLRPSSYDQRLAEAVRVSNAEFYEAVLYRTVSHEMFHIWQAQQGLPTDHGVGIFTEGTAVAFSYLFGPGHAPDMVAEACDFSAEQYFAAATEDDWWESAHQGELYGAGGAMMTVLFDEDLHDLYERWYFGDYDSFEDVVVDVLGVGRSGLAGRMLAECGANDSTREWLEAQLP